MNTVTPAVRTAWPRSVAFLLTVSALLALSGCASHLQGAGAPAAVAVEPAPSTVPEWWKAVTKAAEGDPAFVGISAGVAEGSGRQTMAFGNSVLAPGATVTTSTRFRIGSVSKQFTSAAILLLAEEGRLTLDDKVSRFLPELQHSGEITIRQCLAHTSGYPDYYPLDFTDSRLATPIAPIDLARRSTSGQLDFPPGDHFSYSNTGYVVAGLIVEKASGVSLGDFLQRRIFVPLGMVNTTIFDGPPVESRDARGYTAFGLGPVSESLYESTGSLFGAGGIISTPTDLTLWLLALADGKVLRPASLIEMTTPFRFNDGRISRYGLGLSIRSVNGYQIWGHSGAVAGFQTLVQVIPAKRTAVAICINSEGSIIDTFRDPLIALLTKPSVPAAPVVNGPTIEAVVREWIARYATGNIDRSQLSDEFAAYLTPERLAGTRPALAALGAVQSVDVGTPAERGGFEVSSCKVTCRNGKLETVLYRNPNGKIEQFFVQRR
ncbi:hypothetical protein BH11PLA1_BH11PLA1_11690 [soil metagenome]